VELVVDALEHLALLGAHLHRRLAAGIGLEEGAVDLLKAADCLDRYRLPLTHWWPDPSYLRITVPSWLHAVAFDLVVRSEQARFDGATHHDALTHALALLGQDQ
ncbi:hypothetical protein, partial [Streptosporangium sp. NPDC001681]|uniref:hypothetical protein n=1 Tax=Streptosporangium sp. NPDC001681 TaxID=3154395 RepID=UPI003332C4E3